MTGGGHESEEGASGEHARLQHAIPSAATQHPPNPLPLTVAFINIMKAATPVVTLTLGLALGLERLSLGTLAATVMIAAGTAAATASEADSGRWGAVWGCRPAAHAASLQISCIGRLGAPPLQRRCKLSLHPMPRRRAPPLPFSRPFSLARLCGLCPERGVRGGAGGDDGEAAGAGAAQQGRVACVHAAGTDCSRAAVERRGSVCTQRDKRAASVSSAPAVSTTCTSSAAAPAFTSPTPLCPPPLPQARYNVMEALVYLGPFTACALALGAVVIELPHGLATHVRAFFPQHVFPPACAWRAGVRRRRAAACARDPAATAAAAAMLAAGVTLCLSTTLHRLLQGWALLCERPGQFASATAISFLVNLFCYLAITHIAATSFKVAGELRPHKCRGLKQEGGGNGCAAGTDWA